MVETGVVHGRFQVLHLKHVEYILAAKMRCQKLFIGVTNPDPLRSGDSVNAPYLDTPEANPLTYLERYELLQEAMAEFGVEAADYEIVPFPISTPEYILDYTPREAVYYMGLTSAWDEEKYKILRSLDLDVEILWRHEGADVGTTGTLVRQLIGAGQPWADLVPPTTYRYLTEHGIDERIRRLEAETECGMNFLND